MSPGRDVSYAAPFDRPYDWTVSGDPVLQSRFFGFFVTDEGLEESHLRRRHRPLEAVHRQLARDRLKPDGTVADATATVSSTRPIASCSRPTHLVERAHDHGLLVHVDVPQRATPAGGTPGATRSTSTCCFYELGVDGLFSDFPDTAFTSRELFRLDD